MSLDLDWGLLDEELSTRFLETINRALDSSATKRPSFLGEIHFHGLQFGSQAPEIGIRSITDIWPDFVSLDDVPARRRGVSREVTPASNATTLVESPEEAFPPASADLPLRTYTQFDDSAPPHRILGPPSVMSASVVGSATPASAHPYYQQWSTALASRGIRAAGVGQPNMNSGSGAPLTPGDASVPPSPGYFTYWHQQSQHPSASVPSAPLPPYSAMNSRQTSFDASSFRGGGPGPQSSVSQAGAKRDSLQPPPPVYAARPSFRSTHAASYRSMSGQLSPGVEDSEHPPSSSSLPSLQMHLSLLWPTTTFRLTVTTSLLINYPSPAFMSLPLTLSVTGFVMKAGLIVALEGERRRAHVCLVEDEDEATPPDSPQDSRPGFVGPNHTHADGGLRGKKLSPGAKILPSLSFDSEVGQNDKHVLKNVGKVEKFIGEVLRKGLEDELVFPNYYTIDLPGQR